MNAPLRDPFAVLDLRFGAPLADIRAARRRLARERHPDSGGSEDAMKELNAAFDAAVAHATGRRTLADPAETPTRNQQRANRNEGSASSRPGGSSSRAHQTRQRVMHDHPSFTIEALPAEAFEALLIVASWIGKVLVDEPPYLLDVHLYEPGECWCRLDVVPDAGASTVSITVASADGGSVPDVDDVRDVWVAHLNQLGRWDGDGGFGGASSGV